MFTPTVGEVEQERSGTGSSSAWQDTVANEPAALTFALFASNPPAQPPSWSVLHWCVLFCKNTLGLLDLAQVTEPRLVQYKSC